MVVNGRRVTAVSQYDTNRDTPDPVRGGGGDTDDDDDDVATGTVEVGGSGGGRGSRVVFKM